MNVDLFKKLVRLANANNSEHEANSAARRACRMLEDAGFQIQEAQRSSSGFGGFGWSDQDFWDNLGRTAERVRREQEDARRQERKRHREEWEQQRHQATTVNVTCPTCRRDNQFTPPGLDIPLGGFWNFGCSHCGFQIRYYPDVEKDNTRQTVTYWCRLCQTKNEVTMIQLDRDNRVVTCGNCGWSTRL